MCECARVCVCVRHTHTHIHKDTVHLSMDSVDVLPAPFTPRSPKHSPVGMPSDSEWTATFPSPKLITHRGHTWCHTLVRKKLIAGKERMPRHIHTQQPIHPPTHPPTPFESITRSATCTHFLTMHQPACHLHKHKQKHPKHTKDQHVHAHLIECEGLGFAAPLPLALWRFFALLVPPPVA